jgi:hypothetical protein
MGRRPRAIAATDDSQPRAALDRGTAAEPAAQQIRARGNVQGPPTADYVMDVARYSLVFYLYTAANASTLRFL